MKPTHSVLALLVAATGFAGAASISLNFSENDGNQAWSNETDLIGPLLTSTGSFNTTNNPPGGAALPVRTGDKNAGSLAGLVDDSATATGASVTWASSNVWYTSGGVGTNDAKLNAGYLDDGGSGVNVTFSNIPYPAYNVYVLLGSDQGPGPGYTSVDFTVNGTAVMGGSFPALRNLEEAGGGWIEADGTTAGNYIVASNQTGASAIIQGLPRNGAERGSVVGVIIEEVPEPSTSLLAALAGTLLFLRRRR